ncbi:MAG: adenosylmethionine--8-amino-7-oxononanoate transaminase [candidate division FCPU426 bacterium]
MYDKTKTLDSDRRHLWHPYTQMQDYAGRDPLVIVRAEGHKLFDADGREYFDTLSSWWCNLLGHNQPRLNQALIDQVGRLEHTLFAGITHPWAAEVADRLSRLLPPALGRFFFSDNGSTAVEVALKMAFQYWQNRGQRRKTRFVFLEDSYHGDTVGAMSVGGIALYHKLYAPLRFKSFQAPAPACLRCPYRRSHFTYDARDTGCGLQCFAGMERILRAQHRDLAAVIVEPLLQGSAGISVYPPAYLDRLRQRTRELDVLLVCDEVATGFGRTGTLFAFQQTQAVPDFVCLSKSLTAGYLPLALTATREDIYQAFLGDYASGKTFFHGHTYTANPLACAVACANLEQLETDRLPESRAKVAEYFRKRLADFEAFDFVGDIRHLGFVGAVDIVKSRAAKKAYAPQTRIGFKIYLEGLQRQVLLRPLDNTIYWFLPLTITPEEIDLILANSRESIRAAVANLEA